MSSFADGKPDLISIYFAYKEQDFLGVLSGLDEHFSRLSEGLPEF